MRFEILTGKVTFFLENPKRHTPSTVSFSTKGVRLNEETLRRICSALTNQARGHLSTSQRNYLKDFLRPLLAYFQSPDTDFPCNSNEWQIFLLRFFQYYLVDTVWSTASPNTRMTFWKSLVRCIFEFWILEEIIPYDVVIPSIALKQLRKTSSSQKLLGEHPALPAPIGKPPQKLLVSIEFASPAAEYLDIIESRCREKVRAVQQVCQAHWDALMSDGRSGTQFRSTVKTSEIENAINSGLHWEIRKGVRIPLASDTRPQGHAWALAVTYYLMLKGQSQNCVSIKTLKASKFFAVRTFEYGGFKILAEHTAMPLEAFNELRGYGRYYRFAGILSSLDAAVACCLLTIEHPEFTSDALQSAKLLNPRGKAHLLITDNAQSSIFSLDKPRAGRRKSVALTPLAQQLIKDIVAWTARIRGVLKRAGDKAWRFLFLGYGMGGKLGPLDPNARLLNGRDKAPSLTRLYPALAEQGLTDANFDYRRLRTTMGVLRWFETGSIREMSRRLGNTRRVALEHYLPAALLRAWNTRIIRRFQNTLIVLAAHSEDYLLEVTDFASINDLQDFIAQLLLEYPADSSLLAKEVNTRLQFNRQLSDGNEAPFFSNSILNIKLSAKSLSYLYAYSDFVEKTLAPSALIVADAETGLSPAQFVDLARLIRHACENDSVAADMRELLELPRLRLMHERATSQQATLAAQFSQLSVNKQWSGEDV